MTVRNKELEDIRSSASPKDLSEAMGALHLETIPKEHRARAVMEQVARVMFATTLNPRERAKPAFAQAHRTYVRNVVTGKKGGIIL